MSSNTQKRAHFRLLTGTLTASLLALPACGDSAASEDSETSSGSVDGSGSSSGAEGGSAEAGTAGDGDGDDPCIEVLGDCSNTPSNTETVLTGADGLNGPTDLEFNPDKTGELWVTNREDYSMVIALNTGTDSQSSMKVQENLGGGVHFLAKPAAIAFGTPGVVATAQQEDGWTQPQTPLDFMGPTLWGSSLQTFDGGHAGHIDMLHNSPLSSGMAWAGGNVYWVYDAYHGSLSRYDFVEDHGLGGTDHSDGIMYRTMDAMLGYEPGVPSHVAYDFDTGMVYAAETANGKIWMLDSNTGELGGSIMPDYDGGTQRMVNGATSSALIDGATIDPPMLKPSGIELHEGLLFISDWASGRIYAFDMAGQLRDWMDTGLGANTVMGIEFDDAGNLLVVDNTTPQVVRFTP